MIWETLLGVCRARFPFFEVVYMQLDQNHAFHNCYLASQLQ